MADMIEYILSFVFLSIYMKFLVMNLAHTNVFSIFSKILTKKKKIHTKWDKCWIKLKKLVFSLPNLSHTPIFWGFIDSKRNILTKPINTCWKLKPHIAHIYKRIRTCPSLTYPLILRHKKLHLYQFHNLIFRALWIPNQLVKGSIAQRYLKLNILLNWGHSPPRGKGHVSILRPSKRRNRRRSSPPAVNSSSFGWTDWAGHLLFLKPRDKSPVNEFMGFPKIFVHKI